MTNYNYNYIGMTAKLNAENVLHKICISGLDDKSKSHIKLQAWHK